MQRRKSVSLSTLAWLAVPGLFALTYRSAEAQRPGGPPGPTGSWVVQYNAHGGKVTINGVDSPPWDDRISKDVNGWYTSPDQVGGSDHPGTMPPSLLSTTVTSAGSPQIRLHWTGQDAPPTVAWLLVDSRAEWSSTHGSGSANNEFQDVASATANGAVKQGKHVMRLTGDIDRVWSAAVSATATATSLASETQGQTVAASILIVGALTDRNASLSRTDGGGFNPQSKDDVYQADTLLSWDNSDGVDPGPNSQSLTGTYGGTWTKLSNGTTDNVNINWSGASCGAAGYTPNPNEDHHTTNYPQSGQSAAVMPYADLATCTQKSQDWTYTVSDLGDGTELKLTYHWIYHFAYENFRLQPRPDGLPVMSLENIPQTLESSPPVSLSSTHNSEVTSLSGNTFTFAPSFMDSGSTASIPGFTPQLKHVGIASLTSRIGMTTNKTLVTSTTAHWNGNNDGNYVVEAVVMRRHHSGLMDAWNRRGDTEVHSVRYELDNEVSDPLYGSRYVGSGGA